MPVQVQCPNPECGKAYSVAEEHLGRSAHCRACGQKMSLLPSMEALRDTSQPSATQPGTGALPEELGRFQIRGRLGAGAFGMVYRAYDPMLDREVALKVPQAGAVESPKAAARFLREAKAAAALRHPHIVPIYDAGFDGSRFYIASAYIEGRTLSREIDEEAIDFRRAVEIVVSLAEALDYAHNEGIVHRDVKPSNVMLDSRGEPHLMDFGLARLEGSQEKLTHDGAVLGTPAYMSPEQAKGQVGEAQPAADQYSLGVVLYELLCGEPPFSGPPEIVIFNVLKQEVPAPRTKRPEVPRDLETICLKALSKEPEARYGSCEELAEDLRRWLSDEPIRARSVSRAERLWRWGKREPVVALLSGVVFVLLFVVSIVALIGYAFTANALTLAEKQRYQAEEARKNEKAERLLASQERNHALQKTAESYFEIGRRYCEDGEITRGLLWLARSVETLRSLPRKLRDLEYPVRVAIAIQQSRMHKLVALIETGAQSKAVLSPSGDTVLGIEGNRAVIWDVRTGQPVVPPLEHQGPVTAAAFSPDGKTAVTGCHDQFARLWDTATGKPVGAPMAHAGIVNSARFSPDGKTVITGSQDGTVKLWNAATGQFTGLTLQQGRGAVVDAAMAPDGKFIVSVGSRAKTLLWDVSGDEPVSRALEGGWSKTCVDFSPDGKKVVTGGLDKTLRIWDVATAQQIGEPLVFSAYVRFVQFNPSGDTVVGGSDLGDVRIWDVATGRQVGQPLLNPTQATAASFSRDGETVLTACQDNAVRFWRVAPRETDGRVLKFGSGSVQPFAFDVVGRSLLLGRGRSLQLWDIDTGSLRESAIQNPEVLALAVLSSEQTAVTASGRTVRFWNLTTGQQVAEPLQFEQPVLGMALSTRGKVLVVTTTDGTAHVQSLFSDERSSRTLKERFSVVRFMTPNVAVSSDGKWVLTADHGNAALLSDARTGEPVHPPFHHEALVMNVEFTPDGETAITGDLNGNVKLWDCVTGKLLGRPLVQHKGFITSLRTSSDGRIVFVGSFDGTAQFWDLKTCKPLGWPLEHERPVYRALFCHDGTDAVTFTEASGGRFPIWKVPTPIETDVSNLFRWIGAVGGLQLVEDGTVRPVDVPTWKDLRRQLKKALADAEVIPLDLYSVP